MKIKEGMRRWLFIILLVFGIIGPTAFWFLYEDDGRLKIAFLNVGQGDAAFIETPNHYKILVDAGPPNKSVLRSLNEILPFWDHDIDMAIITHAHDDHFGGYLYLLGRYNIKNFVIGNSFDNSSSYKELLSKIEQNKINIIKPGQEDIVVDGVKIDFLLTRGEGYKGDNQNNKSIVFRLSYKDIDTLFVGDAEKELEEALLNNKDNIFDSEIIKAGHHGSDTSSSESFIDKVLPKIAIISVAKVNKFGHPSLMTIRRFERLGIKFYRTDQDGSIILKTDGYSLFKGGACLIGCSSL